MHELSDVSRQRDSLSREESTNENDPSAVSLSPPPLFQLKTGSDSDEVSDKGEPSQLKEKEISAEEDSRGNNSNGLPFQLKSSMESMSGISLDAVKVHRNSNQPAQLKAHAFAQGNDIHLGPGQEKHLPHEAWHIVQQKQNRVEASAQTPNGININDSSALENEADEMGAKATSKNTTDSPYQLKTVDNGGQVTQLKPFFTGDWWESDIEGLGDIRIDAEEVWMDEFHAFKNKHLYPHFPDDWEYGGSDGKLMAEFKSMRISSKTDAIIDDIFGDEGSTSEDVSADPTASKDKDEEVILAGPSLTSTESSPATTTGVELDEDAPPVPESAIDIICRRAESLDLITPFRIAGIRKVYEHGGPAIKQKMISLFSEDTELAHLSSMEYFIEAINPHHIGYAGGLAIFDEWINFTESPYFTGKNFETWVNQKMAPDKDTSDYRIIDSYGAEERATYEVSMEGKKLTRTNDEALVGDNIYVLSPAGVLYAKPKEGPVHHSSFLEGMPVICAGHLFTDGGGNLTAINNSSGHYAPSMKQLKNALRILDGKMDLSETVVQGHGSEGGIPVSEFLSED